MSNQMNPWLAEIYGTDGAEDIEKTAQAALLHKLAADENIDLSQFTPEELQQLLAEVLGDEGAEQAMGAVPGAAMNQPQVNQQSPQSQGFAPGTDMNPTQAGFGMPANIPGQNGMQQQARPQGFAPAAQTQQPQQAAPQMQGYQMAQQPQGVDQASLQKEAAAKFEEADLLGRVMAHAYTQELEKIATSKTAGRFESAKSTVKGALNSAKNRAGSMAERAGAKAKSYGTAAGMKGRNFAKNNKGALGAAAGGAAAGFAAGRMSKEASAFEKLAEMQAAEILSTTGYDPSTGIDTLSQQDAPQGQPQGQPQQQTYQTQPYMDQQAQFAQPQGQPVQGQQFAGQEQPAVDQEQFQEALDQRSLEMLAAAGYDVNEILARLELANQQNPGQA